MPEHEYSTFGFQPLVVRFTRLFGPGKFENARVLCQKTLENRAILKGRNADTIVCSQTLCFPYSGSVLEAMLLHFSDLGRSWGPFWEGWKSFWRNLGSPGTPF